MFFKKTLKIDNLDERLVNDLKGLACRNKREIEDEITEALEYWANPKTQQALDHRKGIGIRLSHALEEAKKIKGFHSLTPSKLAEKIGESRAASIVSTFSGEAEIPFHMLERLSNELGCSSEWVKHGTGFAYPYEHTRIADYSDILKGSPDVKADLEHIRLIRSDDETGSLYILKEYSDSCFYEFYSTPYHISEEIGTTGQRDLCMLFEALRNLYNRAYTKLKVNVSSYLAHPKLMEDFTSVEKHIHPLNLFKDSRMRKVIWWEDIWDNESVTAGLEHWPGMIKLKNRILDAMSSDI